MRCNRCQMDLSWIAAISGLLLAAGSVHADSYLQHNLVSDGGVAATHTDLNLVNPWGLVFNPGGFWWVADNGTGVSTLYDNNGLVQSLVVQIPPPTGSNDTAAPTGIVLNTTNDFVITDTVNSGPARFIFQHSGIRSLEFT